MTEFPGEIEGDMRKLVLDRCPLLRIFLDPYAQKNHDLWVDMLGNEMLLKRDEIYEAGLERSNRKT